MVFKNEIKGRYDVVCNMQSQRAVWLPTAVHRGRSTHPKFKEGLYQHLSTILINRHRIRIKSLSPRQKNSKCRKPEQMWCAQSDKDPDMTEGSKTHKATAKQKGTHTRAYIHIHVHTWFSWYGLNVYTHIITQTYIHSIHTFFLFSTKIILEVREHTYYVITVFRNQNIS